MKTKRTAMSFLELAIVLLIVGLMAAVAMPRFSSTMRSAHVRAAAIQIAGHIRYVRRVAINEGRSTTLEFSAAKTAYASDVDFPSRIGQLIEVELHDDFDVSLAMSPNLDGQDTLTFDLEGVPHVLGNPLDSGSIVVSSPGVASYRITIAAGTGETTVLIDDGSDTSVDTDSEPNPSGVAVVNLGTDTEDENDALSGPTGVSAIGSGVTP